MDAFDRINEKLGHANMLVNKILGDGGLLTQMRELRAETRRLNRDTIIVAIIIAVLWIVALPFILRSVFLY